MILEQHQPAEKELYCAAMEWLDGHWDGAAGLIKLDPSLSYRGNTTKEQPLHYVRETAYYALGLFIRGETQKALIALDRVLLNQLTVRNTEPCGGFLRHPQETIVAPKKAVEWVEYNPNWREYIGLALAIILAEFDTQLPEEMRERTEEGLRAAMAGSLWRRVPAEYTHIALIKAFLLSFCGVRYDLEAWLEGGEMQGREIFRVFKEHHCFPTYNSPTHYGIDLLALGLWRKYSPSHEMQAMASEMETGLWEDIARFYHAGLSNLAGPYARAYGMDLRSYASPLGLCLWASLGKTLAPFPELSTPFPQQHELAFAIPILAAGVTVPSSLLGTFKTFGNERLIEKEFRKEAFATAWIGKELMVGGNTQPEEKRSHFHTAPAEYPATVHWNAGNGLGWFCAQASSGLLAKAAEKSLSIRTVPNSTVAPQGEPPAFKLLVHSPAPPILSLDKWVFPSLIVDVSSNFSFSEPVARGELFEIECTLPTPQEEGFISLNFRSNQCL